MQNSAAEKDRNGRATQLRIFATHHADFYTIDSPFIENIRAAGQYNPDHCDMRGNDEGDSISERADTFCEMTTQYWVWKNIPDLDYYGFCHYRRFFSFDDSVSSDMYGYVCREYYSEDLAHQMGYDRDDVLSQISKYDIILTEGWDVRSFGFRDIRDQYARSIELNISDLDCAIGILNEKYPQYSRCAEKYLSSGIFYQCNMFIMSAGMFREYSEWIFDILFELEKRTCTSAYSKIQNRMIGHVAERLLGVFVEYQKRVNHCRVGIKKKFIIKDMTKTKVPEPSSSGAVPIVVFSDKGSSLNTAALVDSIASSGSVNRSFDISVLYDGFDDGDVDVIRRRIAGKTNVNIRFLNVPKYLSERGMETDLEKSCWAQMQPLLPELFSEYSRAICIDAHSLVMKDISVLYDMDLGCNLIAGVTDVLKLSRENNGQVQGPNLSESVVLLNFEEIRTCFNESSGSRLTSDCSLAEAVCSEYPDRVMVCSHRWCVKRYGTDEESQIGILCPRQHYSEFRAALCDPWLIHMGEFTDPEARMNNNVDILFWNYIQSCGLYELFLSESKKRRTQSDGSLRDILKNNSLVKGLWEHAFVRKMYFRLLGQ